MLEAFPGNRDNHLGRRKAKLRGAHVTAIDRDFRRPVFLRWFFFIAKPGTARPSIKQESYQQTSILWDSRIVIHYTDSIHHV